MPYNLAKRQLLLMVDDFPISLSRSRRNGVGGPPVGLAVLAMEGWEVLGKKLDCTCLDQKPLIRETSSWPRRLMQALT